MWDRREVRSVGLDQNAIIRDGAKNIVALPILEGDDSTERQAPPGIERRAGELDGAGEAVENAAYAFPSGFADHGRGIGIGITGMHDNGTRKATCKFELCGERTTLEITR